MRLALSLAAAALVACALLLLGLPTVIDRDALRHALERSLETTTGQRATIEGRIDLSLFPRPTARIGRTTLRDTEGAAGLTGDVDRIDLDLAWVGLLRGRPTSTSIRLVRPVMRLPASPRATAERTARWLAARATEASLEEELREIEIVDGTLLLGGKGQPPATLHAFTARLQRTPSTDTSVLSAAATIGDDRWEVRAEIVPRGAAGGARLEADLTGDGWRLGLIGRLRSQDAGPRAKDAGAGRMGPLLEGRLEAGGDLGALAARLGAADLAAALSLEAATGRAELLLDEDGLSIEDGRITTPEGTIELAWEHRTTPTPDMHLDLTVPRLRLADPAATVSAWSRAAAGFAARHAGRIDLRADRAELGGTALRRLVVAATLDGWGGGRLERLSAGLPGGGEVSLEGAMALEPLGFDGTVEAETRHPAAVLEPFAAVADREVGDRALSLTSGLKAGEGRWTLHDMRLRLDESLIEGGVAYVARGGDANGAQRARPQVAASLRIDRLDVATFPALVNWSGAVDPAAWLRTTDHAVDLVLDRLTMGDLRLDGLVLASRARDGRVQLDEFSIGDVTGTTANLSGTVDMTEQRLDLRGDVALSSPARLAGRLGLTLPPMTLAFAPTDLSLDLAGTFDDAVLHAGLTVSGTDGPILSGEATARGSLDRHRLRADLRTPSSVALLRGLGALVSDPAALDGPGVLSLDLERDAARVPVGTATLTLGGVTTTVTLAAGPAERLVTSVEIEGLDVTTAELFYGVAAPIAGMPPSLPSRWPGDWPRRPLGWQWPLGFGIDVDIVVSGHANDAEDGAPVTLAMRLDETGVSGGRATVPWPEGGSVAATFDWRPGFLDGRLHAEDARIDATAGAIPVDLDLAFGARGHSPAELVGDLQGDGRVEIGGDGAGGTLRLGRGILRSEDLAIRDVGGGQPLHLMFDFLAWMIELDVEGEPGRRVFGPLDTVSFERLLAPPEAALR
ncbi:MAG: AsmA family protein [Geminicoccaceae bacterium]|nr:AsmA family protein [Geminicoccaceae bacterium]